MFGEGSTIFFKVVSGPTFEGLLAPFGLHFATILEAFGFVFEILRDLF
jgi:hypothetical protein